nr:hypothetical protein [Tanacetum cinerariifolium]
MLLIITFKSFIHLTLSDCTFEQAGIISWKNLKSLSITYGYLDEDLIENILSGSPLLKTFELSHNYGVELLDITNKSVKNLSLIGYSNAMVKINAPHILSLAFKECLLSHALVLLNVPSVIKAELDYCLDDLEKEEMLKGLIPSLRHVKNLQIGGSRWFKS